MEVVQIGRALANPLSLWVLAVAFSAACLPADGRRSPPKFRLEGSLTQMMDLGYDEARLISSADDVALLFVRQRPMDESEFDGGSDVSVSEDYPFKVTFALRGEEPPIRVRVDLAEEDAAGKQRGIFSRNVLNDTRRAFPRAIRGTLYLSRSLELDARVGGDFHVTFENGIEPASGRTVFGSFDAKVMQ